MTAAGTQSRPSSITYIANFPKRRRQVSFLGSKRHHAGFFGLCVSLGGFVRILYLVSAGGPD